MRIRAVWASRDREGLREAIWRYLTDLPGRGTRARRAALPYAFELWIAHLTLVEQVLELAPAAWRELPAMEMEGVLLLRAARERMQREYRACGECGAAVKGKICPRCGAVER